MNGKVFLETLRKDNQIKKIPILIITASTRPESEDLRSQVQGFLIKPIRCSDLIKEIQNKLPFLFHLSPHNDNLSQVIEENIANDDKIIPMELNSESLSELRERLQQQEPIWKEASDTLIREKLMEFGNNLSQLIHEYPYLPLIQYTQDLNKAIASFDQNRIKMSLDSFPELSI